MFELGNLARLAGRQREAQRFFTESAAAYEKLSARPEANLTGRVDMARDRAAKARAVAKELSWLDPNNLPPATKVLGNPFYVQSASWGGYLVSTLNYVIYVEDPTYTGLQHPTAISDLPVGSWTTLKKRTGEPLPVHVLWNGVELTVRFGGPQPDAPPRAEAQSSADRRFAIMPEQRYHHPEGGISLEVQFPTPGWPVLWIYPENAPAVFYRSLLVFHPKRWTVARDQTGKSLPVRFRSEVGHFWGEWLSLSDPSSWHDVKHKDESSKV